MTIKARKLSSGKQNAVGNKQCLEQIALNYGNVHYPSPYKKRDGGEND
jgi:hypothetical protein